MAEIIYFGTNGCSGHYPIGIDKVLTAWVCVNSFGTELIFETEPHKAVYSWRDDYGSCKCIEIPQGSIKKLIGRELTWNDEPVELK